MFPGLLMQDNHFVVMTEFNMLYNHVHSSGRQIFAFINTAIKNPAQNPASLAIIQNTMYLA